MGVLTTKDTNILDRIVYWEKMTDQTGMSAIQPVQLRTFMEEGCTPVHLVSNLPLTYLFIDILLQKRERVWRMNLAEGFETGHTGL
jgi:hypothetical protein